MTCLCYDSLSRLMLRNMVKYSGNTRTRGPSVSRMQDFFYSNNDTKQQKSKHIIENIDKKIKYCVCFFLSYFSGYYLVFKIRKPEDLLLVKCQNATTNYLPISYHMLYFYNILHDSKLPLLDNQNLHCHLVVLINLCLH